MRVVDDVREAAPSNELAIDDDITVVLVVVKGLVHELGSEVEQPNE